MLLEAESFVYADSSILFESGDFGTFFESMNNGTLTHFQMSGNTGHTIRYATHQGGSLRVWAYDALVLVFPNFKVWPGKLSV